MEFNINDKVYTTRFRGNNKIYLYGILKRITLKCYRVCNGNKKYLFKKNENVQKCFNINKNKNEKDFRIKFE